MYFIHIEYLRTSKSELLEVYEKNNSAKAYTCQISVLYYKHHEQSAGKFHLGYAYTKWIYNGKLLAGTKKISPCKPWIHVSLVHHKDFYCL